MNIQQAKELLPIIQAFAEGRTIQTKNGAGWIDIDEKDYLNIESIAAYSDCFRIKAEPKYRPFNDAEECWQEMQKHQPFAWLKDKKTKEYELLRRVAPKDGVIDQYTCVFERCVFADGTPFGMIEELNKTVELK